MPYVNLKLCTAFSLDWYLESNSGKIVGKDSRDQIVQTYWISNPPDSSKQLEFEAICAVAVALKLIKPSSQRYEMMI